jgi:hypothetical protein
LDGWAQVSYGAWQDPTHIRAFNERSWLYYTDWFWYMGWSDARFIQDELSFDLSELGMNMQRSEIPFDQILRTPRAVDSMLVRLRKIPLSEGDRKELEARKVPTR